MNTSAEIKPSNARPLKWRWRHKKLYFYLSLGLTTYAGALPGLAVFALLFCSPLYGALKHTPVLLVLTALAALVVMVFGYLLGALVTCVFFIMEKICFPEDTGPSSEKHSAQQ